MAHDFKKTLKVNDVLSGQMKTVEFENEIVCIVNAGGKFYAINNVCTHEGRPLAEGTLSEYEVECTWHGTRFDVRPGEVKSPPAKSPVSTYELKIDQDDIWIRKSIK
jgi:nitrite reductase/ring-hydroxylating ferredoxin subunit